MALAAQRVFACPTAHTGAGRDVSAAAWIFAVRTGATAVEAHPQALIDDARALVKAIHRQKPGRLGRAGMPLVKGQVQMLVQAYDAVHGGLATRPASP